MFSNAKTINPEQPKIKGKSKKVEVTVAKLEAYARVKASIKALEGVSSSLEGEIKEFGFSWYVEKGAATGIRPENFRGVEGLASGSIELKSRGGNSALSEDEVKSLKLAGVPFENKVSVVAMFGINPKYMEDMELLGKVQAALEKIVPEDFIVKQEAVSKNYATDETIAKAFENLNKTAPDSPERAHAKAIVKMVTTMAVKPTTSEPMDKIINAVVPLVLPKEAPKAAE